MLTRWVMGLGVAGLLSGCYSWPEAGRGGLAEHYLSHSSAEVHRRWPFLADLPSQQWLKTRIDTSGQYLILLSHLGAKRCMPAKVWLAEQEWVMAQRDFEGGLFEDADTHQRQLAAMNDLLKSKLDSGGLGALCLESDNLTAVNDPLPDRDDVNSGLDGLSGSAGKHPVKPIVNPLRLHFAIMSSELLPGSQDALNLLSDYLKLHPEQQLQVMGHTDSSGQQPLNRQLSIQRAESVFSYLVANGISADRVQLEGLGEDKPLADNTDPVGRATNRRVELVLVDTE